jgi:hypothetical protein
MKQDKPKKRKPAKTEQNKAIDPAPENKAIDTRAPAPEDPDKPDSEDD